MSQTETNVQAASPSDTHVQTDVSLWTTELQQLEGDAAALQKALCEAAEALRTADQVPDESLSGTLTAFQQLFGQVSRAVLSALLSETKQAEGSAPQSIRELRVAVAKLEKVRADSAERREALRQTLAPLDRLLTLQVRSGGDFQPLAECQNKALALKERLVGEQDPERVDEFLQLQAGTHPLCLLWRFVSEWETLSLQESESLRQRVAEEFGNLLAIAVLRRHIILPAADAPTTICAALSDSPSHAALAPHTRGIATTDSASPANASSLLQQQAPSHASAATRMAPPTTPKAKDSGKRALIVGQAVEGIVSGFLGRSHKTDPLEDFLGVLPVTDRTPTHLKPAIARKQHEANASPPPHEITIPLTEPPIAIQNQKPVTSTDEAHEPSIDNTPIADFVETGELPLEQPNDTAPQPFQPVAQTPNPKTQEPMAGAVAAEVPIPGIAAREELPVEQSHDTDPQPSDAVAHAKLSDPGDDTSAPTAPQAVGLPSDTSTAEVVRLIRGGDDWAWPLLIWALFRDHRFGLAYAVARSREARDDLTTVSPAAIRAFVLAWRLRGDYGSNEEEYQSALQDAYGTLASPDSCDSKERTARACLLLSMSLAPALLARGSGAVNVLAGMAVPQCLRQLEELRQAVLRFANLNIDLNPSLLRGVQEHSQWMGQLAIHRDACQEWYRNANQRSIIYAPTTEVWKLWLREDQPLGRMINAVINDQRQLAPQVSDFAQTWRSKAHFEQQLRHADRKQRGRVADLRPIEARAITALRKHVGEALDLLLRWKSLIAAEPTQLGIYQSQQADHCRLAITAHLQGARNSVITQCHDLGLDLRLRGALAVVLLALDCLGNLFKPDVSAQGVAPSLRVLLNSELLRIPGIALDEEWEPMVPNAASFGEQLLQVAVADGKIHWTQAMEAQCQAGNFENAQTILSLVREQEPDKIADAEGFLEQGLAAARERLRLRVSDVQNRVHRANMDGLLNEELFHRLTAPLSSDTQQCMVFAPVYTALDEVQATLEQVRQDRIQAVRDRAQALPGLIPGDATWTRIERVLDSGDVLTANEYLTMAEQRLPLPPARVAATAVEFFPNFLAAMREQVPKMPHLADLPRWLEDRRSLGPLSLDNMPKTLADDAVRLVENWRQTHSRRGNPDMLCRTIRVVLELLGFGVRTVKEEETWSEGAGFFVEAETIRTRETCVIPYFGSEARGNYRILCLWGSPLEHTILDVVGHQRRDVPVLVFYLALMDTSRRRALAHECRSQNRSFLLLDTYLLLYLCGQRNRLASFLNTATWFTAGKPYTTTGAVPPEMFFGRRRQLERIVDMRGGTNLVFGGRQLGKTALLREVERIHHDPNGGFIVKWIDLTHGENIGTMRAIGDIWAVIAKHLCEEGIVNRNVSTPDRLEQGVIDWLQAVPNRRILLLLDEADAFLNGDRTESKPAWAQVSRLKSFMDRTQFRFKVVFAGLHNVQRTARDPNTPMAHLGDPACIGAFLSDEEMRDAQAMIVEPLRALGYEFSSPELPTRILAYTNYYPSLIQVFCRSLLEHLQKQPFEPTRTPPYTITLQDIEHEYVDSKAAILQRFNWSLDLDERYRVLALVIALESVQPGAKARTDGIDVAQVRRESLGYWPQGFQVDTSTEAFRSLLDEMIGLGILRQVSPDHYTLRSPNVINLLGTQQQIERQLEEAAGRQPSPPYEANSFRRKLDPYAWCRSPLTAAQETELLKRENGVTTIFGCPAAGLSDVQSALQQLAQLNIVTLTATTRAAFQHELNDLVRERKDGLTLITIQPEYHWDPVWVADALSQTAKHYGSTVRFFRIVFIGGPQHVWEWVRSQTTEADMAHAVYHTLLPWHDHALRRWLDDLRIDRQEAHGTALLSATGAWGLLLHKLGRDLGDETVRWPSLLTQAQTRTFSEADIEQLFGICGPALPILRTFATLGHEGDGRESQPLSLDDLTPFLDPPLPEHAAPVIRWAELLGYVRLADRERWTLNPLLTRLLHNN